MLVMLEVTDVKIKCKQLNMYMHNHELLHVHTCTCRRQHVHVQYMHITTIMCCNGASVKIRQNTRNIRMKYTCMHCIIHAGFFTLTKSAKKHKQTQMKNKKKGANKNIEQ